MKEWIKFLEIEDPMTRMVVQSLAILFGGFVLAKVINLLISLVRKLITSRTKTDLDDRILFVFERSLQRIVVVIALYIASRRLEMFYKGAWTAYVDGLFFVVLVFLVSMLLSGMIRAVMEWYVGIVSVRTQSQVDEELVPLVKRLANLLLYSIALIICLDHFHIDIKALVVSLGVGSFALAFAAQETLANMIAGFVIMVDRPFRVGDRIRIPSTQQVGDVVGVGLRSTKLLDYDHNIVTIPNAQIIKNEIVNFSYPDAASRLVIEVGIAYESDMDKAKKILEDVCASFDQILTNPKPEAFLVGFGDFALTLKVVARVRHYKNHYEMADRVRTRIYKDLTSAGIEIPLPQRVIRVKSQTTSD
jgi:MscS family membrane protein